MKLKELITKEMIKSGIEETTSVRVTLNGGENLVIASDSDPVLEQEVGEGTETKVMFSAAAGAGFSNGIVDRFMDFEPEDIVDRQRRHRLILTPEMRDDLMNNPENDLFEA